MSNTRSKKSNRRRKKQNPSTESSAEKAPVWPGIPGGHYQPLSGDDMESIRRAILDLLAETGMSEAPQFVVDQVVNAGGSLTNDDRLLFPHQLVNQALSEFPKHFTLHGRNNADDVKMGGAQVHLGTGGAAPQVIDLLSGRYRDSTLRDLYDAARLADQLEHVHFFSRPVVARDMPDIRSLDINTAYACLAGTSKHVCTSATNGEIAAEIAELCYQIAGSKAAFTEQPFLSLHINHAVSPLRFHGDSCSVMKQAALHGIPVHANVFAQVGASTPVTMAGSVVQSLAESIAGGVVAWLFNPDCKIIFGPRPMITDLRTGGMSGGGGEQALVMAATIQMARYLNLPHSCIAGASDSKIADAQSGYEKALSVSLAAHAGCNMVTQACGMQAALMGCSLESYIVDNDMLGAIMSSLKPIEIDTATLATDQIGQVVRSEGHFLGEANTYQRMKSDYVYPTVADRRTPQEWENDGSMDIRQVANQRAQELLASYFPDHIEKELDLRIRDQFDIRLPIN